MSENTNWWRKQFPHSLIKIHTCETSWTYPLFNLKGASIICTFHSQFIVQVINNDRLSIIHVLSTDILGLEPNSPFTDNRDRVVSLNCIPSDMHSDSDASLYVCATPTICPFWSAREIWSSCWLPVPSPVSVVPSLSSDERETLIVGIPPESKKRSISVKIKVGHIRQNAGLFPVDIFGTVVGESPDCLLLSGTVVGENPDYVCWVSNAF